MVTVMMVVMMVAIMAMTLMMAIPTSASLVSSNSTKAKGGPRRFFKSMNTILPYLGGR